MARQAADPIPVTRRRLADTAEPSIVIDAHRVVYIYLRFVRRHRVLLVALPLMAALATAATILSQPRTYQAQLTVTVSRGSEEGSTVVASFRPYLENHGVIGEVIKEFKLDQAPLYLTRTAFLRDYYSVEPVRNTNLVTIRLRLHDRELVARVLNRIGERALELLDRTAFELGSQAQKALKRERDEAASRLGEAATALQNFRTASQIELLRKDVDSALDLRGELMSLSVRIAEQRSRLIQAEADLKTHEQIQQFSRTLEDDALLVEANRQRQQGGTSRSGMTLRSESANPVYEQLAGEVAASRLDVASLVEQRRQLIETKGLGADKLAILSKLYSAERMLGDLERRQAVINAAYTEIATKYELARSRSLDRSAQLVIIDPAQPADTPAPRGLVTKTATAAAGGLGLALLIVLLRPGTARFEQTEVA
jgi:uncharacterized protein involved in exopolysaccharide biosynthesis